MLRVFNESIQRHVIRVYRRFVKLRGEPRAIALGLAFGVFVGMSPLLGLHSVIAVTVAAIFKWSKIAALLGVFVTNPLTAPLIYPVTYTLGAVVLGNPVSLGAGGLKLGDLYHSSPQVLANLFVGGGIIGLVGGAFCYLVAIRIIRQYRRRPQRRDGRGPLTAVGQRLKRAARRQRSRSGQGLPKPPDHRQGRPEYRHRSGPIGSNTDKMKRQSIHHHSPLVRRPLLAQLKPSAYGGRLP